MELVIPPTAKHVRAETWHLGIFCLVFCFATPSFASASHANSVPASMSEVIEKVDLSAVNQGSFVMELSNGQQRLVLPLQTHVNMKISGLVNRVSVKQTFQNNSDDWVNGRYVFPLPHHAAVDEMRLLIGERIIEGQIQPKADAKQLFEKAKAEGKQASLVEQLRPNMFTTSVANLAPHDSLVVEISYQETLSYDKGEFSVRFPMVVAPRYSPIGSLTDEAIDSLSSPIKPLDWARYWPISESAANVLRHDGADRAITSSEPDVAFAATAYDDVNRVQLTAVIDAGFPLVSVKSSYHQITTLDQADGSTLIRLKGVVAANRDFVLNWQPEVGESPEAAVFVQQGQTHGESTIHESKLITKVAPADEYSLLMLMPPQSSSSLPQETLYVPRELILVIDTSGSMSGDSIAQAKQSLLYALSGLRPQDSFNIYEFNSNVSALSAKPLTATASNIGKAQTFVRRLQADGGTEMGLALKAALGPHAYDVIHTESQPATSLRQVLFITDGAVGNETELFELIRNQLGESRLFTVGIGSAPNAHFMTRAAELGRGTFTYIGDVTEVQEKIQSLLSKMESPVVTDIQVRYPDGTVPDYWPAQIADLYAGEPVLISIKARAKLQDTLLVSGFVSGQFWQQSLSLTGLPKASGLDVLWARAQIKALTLNQQASNHDRVKQQITALAMKYHLVSDYTSLVAVDVTPLRPNAVDLKEGDVGLHLPAGWQVGLGSMPQTASSSLLDLVLGGCLMLLAALLLLAWPIQHRQSRGIAL